MIDTSDHCVTLAWKEPEYDGEEPILGYELESMMEGEAYQRAGYVGAGTLTFRVTRLQKGLKYTFKVSCENRVGLGQPAITDPVCAVWPDQSTDAGL